MKAGEIYRTVRKALVPVCGEFADYEARMIVCHVIGITYERFAGVLASYEEQPEKIQKTAEDIVCRRQNHEPLAYILGYADFGGRRFMVSANTLIPRADTEVLCEQAISFLPSGGRFADIGTGSGCIALTVLAETVGTTAVGYDISDGALSVARENAINLGLSDRFQIVCSDIFSEDFMARDGLFDLIVSNPPYIASEEIPKLSPEVRSEPHSALDGGADGLCFYRRLLDTLPAHIKPGGHLLFEIGYDQRAALDILCRERALRVDFVKDFGGKDRVCIIYF